MMTTEKIQDLIGELAHGPDGSKIGKLEQVYLDDATGRPEWVTISTGLFGTNESFVPLAEAEYADGALRLPYSKDKIKDAPNVDVDSDRHLSADEEVELYRYYGLETSGGYSETTTTTDTTTGVRDDIPGYTDSTTTTGTTTGTTTDTTTGTAGFARSENEHGTVGRDTSGPTTDDAMTRSEEQLRAGTERREAGKARLRKYVETERQEVRVPVSHEEVRVETEPITDANRGAALDGPAISEEEHEVTLTEERPVVTTEAVPVERVRLAKETVTEEETVSADVRKERIETDVDETTRRS